MRLFADRLRARSAAMQRSLAQQLRYEHLQREHGIAHDIQVGMLAHQINLEPEIAVAAQMIPAQQVGGGFYDGPADGMPGARPRVDGSRARRSNRGRGA